MAVDVQIEIILSDVWIDCARDRSDVTLTMPLRSALTFRDRLRRSAGPGCPIFVENAHVDGVERDIEVQMNIETGAHLLWELGLLSDPMAGAQETCT